MQQQRVRLWSACAGYEASIKAWPAQALVWACKQRFVKTQCVTSYGAVGLLGAIELPSKRTACFAIVFEDVLPTCCGEVLPSTPDGGALDDAAAQAQVRAASFEFAMFIERQPIGPKPPPLTRHDSFDEPAQFDDMERSIDDIGHWDLSARQMLQPGRGRANSTGMRETSFAQISRQPAYLQGAPAPRALPSAPVRSYSAVVAGVPRSHVVDTPEMKAHRLGLDSHGRVIASHVQASANALIAAFGPKIDVDATIVRLKHYIDTYAARWPTRILAQRRQNGGPSMIDEARAYTRGNTRYALNHKDNAHYYLAGHKGEPPGVHMRDLCALAWYCAETWVDPTQVQADADGRQMLQEAIVRALADFTLESSEGSEFRCTSGQLVLLMRALQGWFSQVSIDVVEPSLGNMLQPPTANQFMRVLSYNLEVISRSVPPTDVALVQKANDAMLQAHMLYQGRCDRNTVLIELATQIQSYYVMTYDLTWLWQG